MSITSSVDEDLKLRVDAKYSFEREVQAKRWLEILTDIPMDNDFHTALKDGVALCKAANIIIPNRTPIKYSTMKVPFKQMDNISQFLTAVTEYGLLPTEIFQTVDLFESKNLIQVIDCIFALSRHADNNGFEGPSLNPKIQRKRSQESLRSISTNKTENMSVVPNLQEVNDLNDDIQESPDKPVEHAQHPSEDHVIAEEPNYLAGPNEEVLEISPILIPVNNSDHNLQMNMNIGAETTRPLTPSPLAKEIQIFDTTAITKPLTPSPLAKEVQIEDMNAFEPESKNLVESDTTSVNEDRHSHSTIISWLEDPIPTIDDENQKVERVTTPAPGLKIDTDTPVNAKISLFSPSDTPLETETRVAEKFSKMSLKKLGYKIPIIFEVYEEDSDEEGLSNTACSSSDLQVFGYKNF
ncbi:calponin homology domain-containing protein [Globomyces pollinis-pini]|nr:calponin homology domain-containing protein [Globomyces pollinis-pini]